MILDSWNKRDKVVSCTEAAFFGNKVLSAEQEPVPLVWLLTFLLVFQRHLPLHPVQKDPFQWQGALGEGERNSENGKTLSHVFSLHEENCMVKK